MSRQADRIDKILTKFVADAFNKKVEFSEDYPDVFRTVLNIAGLNDAREPKQKELKITALSVIGTDNDHTIFGLGNDGKPYVWDDGSWVVHS